MYHPLSISGLIKKTSEVICEGAEQLLYMANYNLLKNKYFRNHC